MPNPINIPNQSQLGKKTEYSPFYNSETLFTIPRKLKRDEIGVPALLPFYGFDLWNHYEVSWLNEKGKPIVALAEIRYDCHTPNIIESKSMKLYFNSFNNTKFKDVVMVTVTIERDIAARVGGAVNVKIFPLPLTMEKIDIHAFTGINIDNLDIDCTTYTVDPNFLTTENEYIEESLYSDLLKSNCLVTNQPDWGSVQIAYKGRKISHEGLLRYLISFRNHNEFHEQCIERIFMDIMRKCSPDELTVYGRYTRRGGIDINPYRSTKPMNKILENRRLCRQ